MIDESAEYWAKKFSDLSQEHEDYFDRAEAKIAEINAEVREWLCEDCNIVYQGPPKWGIWSAMCTKCGGATGPRNSVELRKAKKRIAKLQNTLEEIRGWSLYDVTPECGCFRLAPDFNLVKCPSCLASEALEGEP